MHKSEKEMAFVLGTYAVTLALVVSTTVTHLERASAVALATETIAADQKISNILEATAAGSQELTFKADEIEYLVLQRQAMEQKATRSKEQELNKYSQQTKLSATELAKLLTHVGFEGAAHKLAFGIAMRESTGRPAAHNDNPRTGDNSYGLFQINMIGSLGEDRRAKYGLSSNKDLFDPVLNARIAYKMSNKGTDFGAWGIGPNAYRSGAGENTISKWYSIYPGQN
jgi:soluble lytic murein transglycosylase-like protein